MYKILCLLACLAVCHGYAVHPVLPVHSARVIPAPIVSPYLSHGYYGYGYGGIVPKVHHLFKRSPHYVTPLAHVSPVVFPPVAVSHQARADAHTAPAVVAAPLVPVVRTLSSYVSPVAYGPYGVAHYGHGSGHY